MNTARIVVLTFGAGGGAAHPASGSDNKLPPPVAQKDDQNTVVGRAVPFELKPEQAETPARVRQTGTLSPAQRSIADLNAVEIRSGDQAPRRGDNIDVVRRGVPSPTTQKSLKGRAI